jgi:hypothetical protein
MQVAPADAQIFVRMNTPLVSKILLQPQPDGGHLYSLFNPILDLLQVWLHRRDLLGRLYTRPQCFRQLSLAGLCNCLFQVAFLLRYLVVLVNRPPRYLHIPGDSPFALAQPYAPNNILYVIHVFPLHAGRLQILVWKHSATLQGGTHSGGTTGTHSGDHAWYTFRRSRLVYIQAATTGTY